MIIEKLELRAFGRFTSEVLDLKTSDSPFHLVYGPNESGKSTCLRAITALLFGIPNRSQDGYLHGNAKLRIGATLTGDDGESLQFVRRKNGRSKLYDAEDQKAIDPAQLQLLLGGIDESTFHHRFGLSHEQLVEGGKAILESKGELGEILFAAGAGVGRLNEIRAQLEEESKSLFLERGKKKLNLLIKDLEERRGKLRELQTPAAEYDALAKRLAESESRARQSQRQISEATIELEKLSDCRKAISLVPQWRKDQSRLTGLADVPLLDEDFSGRRREAQAKREAHQGPSVRLKEEVEELERKIDESVVDRGVIENQNEIVALYQSIAGRKSSSVERQRLLESMSELNLHLCESLRELGVAVDEQGDRQAIDRGLDALRVDDATRVRVEDLSRTCEVLRTQEVESIESLEAMRKQLLEYEDEIDNRPSVGDVTTLEMALSEIGSPASLIDRADEEQANCHELDVECQRLVRELRLGDQDPDAVVTLMVPTPEQIGDHENRITKSRNRLENAEAELGKQRDSSLKIQEQLATLADHQRLPTEVELEEARSDRDGIVRQVGSIANDQKKVREAAAEIRQKIQTADDVVDEIRRHHEQVTERASLKKTLGRLKQEIVRSEEQLAEADASLDENLSTWSELWKPLGVQAGSPGEMRGWVATHQVLAEKHSLLQKARGRSEQAKTRIHRSTQRLASALAEAWSERPVTAGGSDLPTRINSDADWESEGIQCLFDHASRLRNEMRESASQLQHRRSQRDQKQAEIPVAEAKLESIVRRRQQWQRDWNEAVSGFSGEVTDDPKLVGLRLKKIDALFDQVRTRNDLLKQIRAIDQATELFESRVETLTKLCGSTQDRNQSSVDIAQELYASLQESKSAAESIERSREDLRRRREQLESHRLVLVDAQGTLKELCREARVDSEDDLEEITKHAAEKRSVLRSFQDVERQFAQLAGNQTLEDFAAEVESLDAVELDTRIAELENSRKQLQDQQSELLQDIGALKREVAMIDGSDQAAELNQELQLLSAGIDRQARQYARLRIASLILRRSIEHYRSENESPVLKLAGEAFSELTCGRYCGLRPDYDDRGNSKLFGVMASPDGKVNSDGGEELVPVEAMSLGTADAVYLAMRLASLEHQLESGNRFPVVIDDCLIQLDDERTVAAMKRFARLASRTQVILFSHHSHLIELARRSLRPDEFQLHQLTG